MVNKWSEALRQVLNDKSWTKMVEGVGDQPAYLGASEVKAFVTDEVKRYREIFTELGLLAK